MVSHSFFLGLVYSAFSRLKAWYSQCLTKRLIDALCRAFATLFSGSVIFGGKNKGKRDIAPSKTAAMCDCALELPLRALEGFWGIFFESLIGKAVIFLASKLEYALGLCFFLFLCVPHVLWNNIYGLIIAAVLFLLFLVRCAYDKDIRPKVSVLHPFYLLVVLSMLFAVINAYSIGDSVRVFAIDLTAILLVFVAVNLINDSRKLNIIIYSIIAGITAISVYGLYQYAMGIPVDLTMIDVSVSGEVGRVYSTMGNPNNYGEILVLFIPLFAYAVKRAKSLDGKFLICLLTALPLVNLILSYSRSSWIGFAASAVLFVIIIKPRWLPAILILGILCIPLLPEYILSRILSINNDSSSAYRITIWESSLSLIKDHPLSWLTGIGLGPIPFAHCIDGYMVSDPAHSHMLLLEILIETGIVGVISIIGFALGMIRNTVKQKGEARIVAASLLCGMGACFVVGFFEYVWFYPRVMWFFFIAAGLLMCVTKKDFKFE